MTAIVSSIQRISQFSTLIAMVCTPSSKSNQVVWVLRLILFNLFAEVLFWPLAETPGHLSVWSDDHRLSKHKQIQVHQTSQSTNLPLTRFVTFCFNIYRTRYIIRVVNISSHEQIWKNAVEAKEALDRVRQKYNQRTSCKNSRSMLTCKVKKTVLISNLFMCEPN